MKRPNITPGPWKAVNINGTYIIRDAKSRTVSENPGVTYQDDANAKAISAIPKLLAVLEEFALCELSEANCASFEVANKRIQALAKLVLIEAGYAFD
jgi:hypothetical protein